MKQYFQKIDKLNLLTEPNYLSDNAKDILNDKPKQLVALDKLIEEFEKNEQKINQTIINKDLSGVKIPKMNPLMSMPKVFNKFDMVPGNMINPFPNIEKNLNEEKK
jgi:hypothetical protein